MKPTNRKANQEESQVQAESSKKGGASEPLLYLIKELHVVNIHPVLQEDTHTRKLFGLPEPLQNLP